MKKKNEIPPTSPCVVQSVVAGQASGGIKIGSGYGFCFLGLIFLSTAAVGQDHDRVPGGEQIVPAKK